MINKKISYEQMQDVKQLMKLLRDRNFVVHLYPKRLIVSFHGYKKLNITEAIPYMKNLIMLDSKKVKAQNEN